MSEIRQSTKALIGLRELILSGELPAGERLVELTLVQRLRVSRTPIRSALARLADEGLVEKVGGGYAVREFRERDIAEAIELRGIVEGMAARVAAERGARADLLPRARQCVVELDAMLDSRPPSQPDVEAFLSINRRFHAHIIELADSFVIGRTLDHICALPFASPNAFVMAQSEIGDMWKVFFIAQQQHRSMLEAIENGEGARAESIAREHAQLSLNTLRSVLRTRTGMHRVPGIKLLLLSNGA